MGVTPRFRAQNLQTTAQNSPPAFRFRPFVHDRYTEVSPGTNSRLVARTEHLPMKARLCLPTFCLLISLAPAALAQVPPEKAIATFTLSEGLEISLWASEPLFVNPTCMDIDHKGRVWVCESVNYRCHLHHQPLRRPAGDRIVILEDTKGTGKADKVTTFYQSPELLAPLGIAVAKDPVGPGYKVYVCQSPDILLFEDRDGDGKADGPPKKLLTGFRGIDHDHGVHGISIGPDAKLYFSVGDQGVENLQSADGKGRKWTTNHTDCQGGTIWRCDLDGRNLEMIAHNFRNEYEPCVDSFGTIFVSDNDDDGHQQTRICYVMPGGNYGYWPRGPAESHWHEDKPGVVPKVLRTYFGSPTGMCFYEGTLLPKKYWGQLLHTDAGPRHVRCYHLTPEGAGYKIDREDMVTSTDTWFRPSDVCVAPDGSVFVSDWYDPGVGGHGMGDTERGRIFRLVPKGHKGYQIPKVDLRNTYGLLNALGSPAQSVRYMAMATIEQQFSRVSSKFWQAVYRGLHYGKGTPWLRARAVWYASLHDQPTLHLLHDPDPRFGCLAFRKLLGWVGSQQRGEAGELALQALMRFYAEQPGRAAKLKDTALRREMLLALARYHAASSSEALIYELAKQYDGKDRFYLEAIGIAVGHDPERRKVILADFDKVFPEWNDKVAKLIWELQPPAVVARLEKRLQEGDISAAQLDQVVEILLGSEEESAGKALIRSLATNLPSQLRDRILDKLKPALEDKWKGLRDSKEMTATIDQLLANPQARTLGLTLLGASGQKVAIGKVVSIARDEQEPAAVRAAAIRALGSIRTTAATAALEKLVQSLKSSELRVEVVQALAAQPEIYAGINQPAMKALCKMAGSHEAGLPEREAAILGLLATHSGTGWLLEASQRKELPAELQPEVARRLRSSPFGDWRGQALAAFPAPRLNVQKLPAIAILVQRRGDAQRGKEVLAASARNDLQCLKCHTIAGTGGNVGPDLSVIGKKASRENLYESILFPSKAIADQYINWQIATRNGVVLNGLIVEETADHVTLRDANARDTRIDKKDIEQRSKSPNSLMPSDLLAYMTEDDLVDIVEYLFSLK
jgi:putative membrane-bound dehydrogenase-like protein